MRQSRPLFFILHPSSFRNGDEKPMSLIKLSVKHNRTREEARTQLQTAVSDVRSRFGSMVQRVETSADRDTVKMFGTGFEVELRVDDQEVHVRADLPFLGGLL